MGQTPLAAKYIYSSSSFTVTHTKNNWITLSAPVEVEISASDFKLSNLKDLCNNFSAKMLLAFFYNCM